MSETKKQSEALAMAPWKRFLFGRPVRKVDDPKVRDHELGYRETGEETIRFLVSCIRDGRHAMLVGPRGTGKSYMAAEAVRQADLGGAMGVVQRIEIQGDPNKPPSDYFDDSISFSKSGGKLVPTMINAPFFKLAKRAMSDNGGGEAGFVCHPDSDNRILLTKTCADGLEREVDRIVIFWDEGNRSSPAMLNAVLGLLAEGRLRRDGIAYAFPPVSCILTRNPDGYDANSAKMPSPLIDRFGVQFYVYNPTLTTFVGIIAPAWLHSLRVSLLREVGTALARVVSPISKSRAKTMVSMVEHNEGVIAFLKGDNGSAQQTRFPDALEIAKTLEEIEEEQNKKASEDSKYEFIVPPKDIEHLGNTLLRLARVPEDSSHYREFATRLALVVLVTWGDHRSTEEKPGMQYLPKEMRGILDELAKDRSVATHLREVGDLTRYGTSIRAFEEMLKASLAPVLDGRAEEEGVGNARALSEVGMKELRSQLGGLLGHRCETSFNPDREPAKARRKTQSLYWLAKWILDDCRADAMVKLAKLDDKSLRVSNGAIKSPQDST